MKVHYTDEEEENAAPSRLLEGIPLSEGRSEGWVWHAHGGIPPRLRRRRTITENLVASEISKIRHAFQLLSLVLENSILHVTEKLGRAYGDIFIAIREMLHDPMLLTEIISQIEKELIDAGSAMTATLELFQKKLSAGSDSYMKERINDLAELQGSLLDALARPEDFYANSNREDAERESHEKTIAVVETLTPRLVLDLKNTKIFGIVCEHAGPTSHAAILCRAFGLPAVEGISDIFKQLPQGAYAMMDGSTGKVGTGTLRKAVKLMLHEHKSTAIADAHNADLSQIVLMANLHFAHNAISALSAGAEGIGLYRTEFEFMAANRLLTRHEQTALYRSVVIAMMGLPVTIRLIDIAVDKSADFFNQMGNLNDLSLGGAEFLLARPELLETQACAIAEASVFGPVRVLYPMVANAEQFVRLKTIFCNAAGNDSARPMLHGAMIEQPSAVDDAVGIFDVADFACLGTNDLTKHLLEVDRGTAVAHGSEIVNSSKLWDAFGIVASAASAAGKELTVCGEMASDFRLLERFSDLGMRRFSMAVRKLRRLKKYAGEQESDED